MTNQTTELAVFDSVAATIAEYKVENEKLVFAYDTPDGNKEARSHIAKLRKVKTEIANIHKDAKAEALAYGRRLDAKKNEYTGEVDGMIAVHKDPLDAIAAEKQAIIDAEIAKAAAEEEKRLEEIEARERAVREAEERIAKAKAESERVEREKKIAEEAGERARVQAEMKAKAAADAKELLERVRKDKEEAAEQKRIANKKHRKEVEDAIHLALTEMSIAEFVADEVLSALKENKIPHVTIVY